MCVKKEHGGKSCDNIFSVFVETDQHQGSCKKRRSKTFTMALIDINVLLPEDLDLATLARDAITVPPASGPHNNGTVTVPLDQNSPHQNISPLQGRNFITAEAIGEAEATTLEDIAAWIM